MKDITYFNVGDLLLIDVYLVDAFQYQLGIIVEILEEDIGPNYEETYIRYRVEWLNHHHLYARQTISHWQAEVWRQNYLSTKDKLTSNGYY